MFSGRMLGNMKRPMNSMSMGPLLHFLCYEMTSLIGVCNSMVSKTSCKFMDRTCGRCIMRRQDKSIRSALNPKISVVYRILVARNLFYSRCLSLHLKGTVPAIRGGGREEVWHASGSPCFLSQKTPRRMQSPTPRNKHQGWGQGSKTYFYPRAPALI